MVVEHCGSLTCSEENRKELELFLSWWGKRVSAISFGLQHENPGLEQCFSHWKSCSG